MSNSKKAWVVSIDMGYGHDRAAYPLKDLAKKRIITANNDKIISEDERERWYKARHFYEKISRLKEVPLFGRIIFNIYDRLQSISPFFPFRDLSKPTFVVIKVKNMIKKGFGSSLIDYLNKEKIPIICTHWMPALMAHYNNLENPIYCIITDTDINRIWVAKDPLSSKIKYFSPCEHVVVRLREYGVPEENIIETGFPLPKENIGINQDKLKKDLAVRLKNLDPKLAFHSKYGDLVKTKLGKYSSTNKKRILTLTYMIGGAGAEKEIGIEIIKSLKGKIKAKKIKVNLVAGTRLEIRSHFMKKIKDLGLENEIGKGIDIIYALGRNYYFNKINKVLRDTDIIWTKPSEMSFYCALGLPIIIAPPVGAHENFNKEWLEHIGSGIIQCDPKYANDWIFYWLDKGRFADSAWKGFLDAPSQGTYEIEKIIEKN